MIFEVVPFKFVHWECNKENLDGTPITKQESYYTPNRVVKPNTQITNGLYIRWTSRVYTATGLVLSCIAEEIYLNEKICDASDEQLKEIVNGSFFTFKLNLDIRTKEDHFEVNISHSAQDSDVEIIRRKLKCK
jgi:hypothetical protein